MANIGSGVVLLVALGAAGCSHPAPSATEVLHVVAVDPAGGVNPGFSVLPDDGEAAVVIDCAASPAAVSANIYQCWPSAAAADVCWPVDASTLLCLLDPWAAELHRVTTEGGLPSVRPQPEPQPLALVLDDGTRCRLRTGGAWGGRDDGYTAAYGCESSGLTVLAAPDGAVIDRRLPRWTVNVGELGVGDMHLPPPQTRTVRTAWFAGRPG